MRLTKIGGTVRRARHWIEMLDTESAGTRLSFDQERRLLVEEWAREHSVTHVQPHLSVGLWLNDDVSTGRVEDALNAVVARHQPLRAYFGPAERLSSPQRSRMVAEALHTGISVGGLHQMKIMSEVTLVVSEESVGNDELPVAAVYREVTRPFSLDSPPLLRGTILREGSKRLLVLTGDRLVIDWPSMSFILAALRVKPPAAGLRPAVTSQRVRSTPLLQYRASIAYWRTEWKDLGFRLLDSDDLPFPLPAARIGSRLHGASRIVLEHRASEALRRMSVLTGRSLPIIMLSAVSVALYHATQHASLSMWTDFRQTVPKEVGPLSHSHAITIDLTGTSSFEGVMNAVRASIAIGASHHQVPLDLIWRLTAKCALPKTGQVSFQHVVLRPQGTPDDIGFDGWPMFDTDPRMSLTLRSYEDHEDIGVCANYAGSRFLPESIDGLLVTVQDVIVAVLEQIGLAPLSNDAVGFSISSLVGSPDSCYLCRQGRARLRPDRPATSLPAAVST